MANQKLIDRLLHGAEKWNMWRAEYPLDPIDLSYTNFIGANLSYADLTLSNLSYVRLNSAKLRGTDLSDAKLRDADLDGANLSGANLTYAKLIRIYLDGAILKGADIGWTTFGDIHLRAVKGLETVHHNGPSTIGTDTILHSEGDIPEVFLRGARLSDTFITYARSLTQHPIEYYTCFISYSSRDEVFAKRLYADLQSHNVRCWFALEDMNLGDKIRPRIEETIRLYDKLLLVLSKHSIASNWVAYEVERALNKEPTGIPNVLFSIRLDDEILTCSTDWAQDIKDTRHIGDFTNRKDHDFYQKSFDRLLRALKQSS